jgi:predicted nucleotidyltransferase
MTAIIHPALPALIEKLAALGAKKIILYGSRARGDHTEKSDIDLAIQTPENIDIKIWDAMLEAAENADTLLKIDLVNLHDTNDKLKSNILRDGKTLYDATA